MKARNLMALAGLCVVAGVAGAQTKQLGQYDPNRDPGGVYRLAPLTLENGQFVVGMFSGWFNSNTGEPVGGFSGRTIPAGTFSFDGMEVDYGPGVWRPAVLDWRQVGASTDFPAGGFRWWYGSAQSIPHVSQDFTVKAGTEGRRLTSYGHFVNWGPTSAVGTTEACYQIFRFWDSHNGSAPGNPGTFDVGGSYNPANNTALYGANWGAGTYLGGFVVELRNGATAASVSGFPGVALPTTFYRHYSLTKVPSIKVFNPVDGKGAVEIISAQTLTNAPAWTGNNAGEGPTTRPAQGSGGIDDPGVLNYTYSTRGAPWVWATDNNDPYPGVTTGGVGDPNARRAGRQESCGVWAEFGATGTDDGTFSTAPVQAFDFGCTAPWTATILPTGPNTGQIGPIVGSWMQFWKVNDALALPACATLTDPANGATGVGTSVTLTATGAGTKIFRLSVNANMFPVVAQQIGAGNTFVVNGLPANTTFYWTVFTENNDARAAACNGVFSFQTAGGADPCAPFDLNSDDVVDFNDYLEFLNGYNACQ